MENQEKTTTVGENQDVLLRMEGICKTFPGVKALDNVNLSVRRGTVHALMGENGAGKSTLMKCLFGVYSKDAGHIYLDGKEIDFKNSKEALENGSGYGSSGTESGTEKKRHGQYVAGTFPESGKVVPADQ